MKRLTARTLRRCERREIEEALAGGEDSPLAEGAEGALAALVQRLRARREAREEVARDAVDRAWEESFLALQAE